MTVGHWWGGAVVLIAAVNRDMRYTAFELYRRGLVPGHTTRNNPNPPDRLEAVLVMPQIVAGALGSPSISIPLRVLFDVPPRGLTGTVWSLLPSYFAASPRAFGNSLEPGVGFAFLGGVSD